ESPPPKKPRPTPTPTPPPAASPVPTDNAILKRNMEFDATRSKAITHYRQGEVDPAISTFNAAFKIKPNDRSVQIWLDAIKAYQQKKAAAASPMPGQFQNPTNANAPGVAGRPGVPAPPGVPQVPQVNGANSPMSVPTAGSQIDPRLVF